MRAGLTRLLIIGAGGHAKVVADAAIASREFDLVGFADDNPTLHGREIVTGFRVLGAIADRSEWPHDAIVLGIGNNAVRREWFRRLSEAGECFATILHPAASIAAAATIGAGSVAMAGVVVNIHARIGANVILNTSSSVDHDTSVGDHAHIAPGAHLAGGCSVGQGALVGIGAVVSPSRRVGTDTVVGAGAAVVTDLPDYVTAMGVPARIREER